MEILKGAQDKLADLTEALRQWPYTFWAVIRLYCYRSGLQQLQDDVIVGKIGSTRSWLVFASCGAAGLNYFLYLLTVSQVSGRDLPFDELVRLVMQAPKWGWVAAAVVGLIVATVSSWLLRIYSRRVVDLPPDVLGLLIGFHSGAVILLSAMAIFLISASSEKITSNAGTLEPLTYWCGMAVLVLAAALPVALWRKIRANFKGQLPLDFMGAASRKSWCLSVEKIFTIFSLYLPILMGAALLWFPFSYAARIDVMDCGYGRIGPQVTLLDCRVLNFGEIACDVSAKNPTCHSDITILPSVEGSLVILAGQPGDKKQEAMDSVSVSLSGQFEWYGGLPQGGLRLRKKSQAVEGLLRLHTSSECEPVPPLITQSAGKAKLEISYPFKWFSKTGEKIDSRGRLQDDGESISYTDTLVSALCK